MLPVGGLPPLLVLVVDDDAEMRLYIRKCVEALPGRGRRVVEAGDGVVALTLARAGAADVIISDVRLPRMDGTRLCEGIKADPRLCHIPVLLISGADNEGTGQEDGFLPKPFNARQLRDALERMMGR